MLNIHIGKWKFPMSFAIIENLCKYMHNTILIESLHFVFSIGFQDDFGLKKKRIESAIVRVRFNAHIP